MALRSIFLYLLWRVILFFSGASLTWWSYSRHTLWVTPLLLFGAFLWLLGSLSLYLGVTHVHRELSPE